MKRINAKHFILLCAPPLLLLGFASVWSSKADFRLKSVQVRRGVDYWGTPDKNWVAVDVFTEYTDPSLYGYFLEKRGLSGREDGIWYDIGYGLYVEDEHGVRYGKGYPPDTKTYRPINTPHRGMKTTHGILFNTVGEDRHAWTISLSLAQFSKSAGKLTLKTRLESGPPPSKQLPIAVVVRE